MPSGAKSGWRKFQDESKSELNNLTGAADARSMEVARLRFFSKKTWLRCLRSREQHPYIALSLWHLEVAIVLPLVS